MLVRRRRSGKTDRLQPMDERAEGVDLEASPNSDKPEKPLRFNSASSCLLSECALKVFSRRNPFNPNTALRYQTAGRAFPVHYISNPKRPGVSFEEASRQRCVSDITLPVQGARAPHSRTAQENSISITSSARASSVGGTSNASGGHGALRRRRMFLLEFRFDHRDALLAIGFVVRHGRSCAHHRGCRNE